jgi:putative MATE family efflux protein
MQKAGALREDLTQGRIFGTLLRLALPIAGSQIMHMMYNLTDMFWMGRIGSDALAATGTAGLFIWLSVGLMLIGRVGTEIGVSQARGRGDVPLAFRYARAGLYIAVVLGLLFGVFLFTLREQLVGLFNFREQNVAEDMAAYLRIIAFGIPFTYVSAAVGGAFGASGNTKTPFVISSAGLAVNMVLSPIFIFILGMGIHGAALTSVMAQAGVAVVSLVAVKKFKSRPFEGFRFFGGLTAAHTVAAIAKALWKDIRI